ncbi:MAG: SPOR domain-containing protein [Chromatiales bacterium]|nr:SPOR domain-containing protein [Chromatiales bacterium]
MTARNDYAKRTTSRGGPRKTSKRKSSPQKTIPGWVWLLAGLSIGLFIAFLISISDQKIPKKSPTAVKKEVLKKKSGKADPKKTKSTKHAPEGVKFDFYQILPEMELVIPEDEIKNGAPSSAPPSHYIIQVGSFKNASDAESLRAQLFLLNFEPSLQTVSIDGKQSWHRVRLGPFSDHRKLNLAQRQLQDSNIEFITLKERN